MPNLIPSIELRRRKVFELMRAGYSEEEVVTILGGDVALKTVKSDIRAVLADSAVLHQENIDQVRALELARLDRLSAGAFPYCLPRKAVINGTEVDVPPDPNMGYYYLALMDRRAKYLGLNAPQQRVTLSIPWEKLSIDQIARVAAGEDLKIILAELEAKEVAPREEKREEKDVTPKVDVRTIPVEVMVDADHPLARLTDEELDDVIEEVESGEDEEEEETQRPRKATKKAKAKAPTREPKASKKSPGPIRPPKKPVLWKKMSAAQIKKMLEAEKAGQLTRKSKSRGR